MFNLNCGPKPLSKVDGFNYKKRLFFRVLVPIRMQNMLTMREVAREHCVDGKKRRLSNGAASSPRKVISYASFCSNSALACLVLALSSTRFGLYLRVCD